MNIVCPGDAVEVRLALRAALRNDSPVYLRLGKKNEPVVHKEDPPSEIGKGITVVKGTDSRPCRLLLASFPYLRPKS